MKYAVVVELLTIPSLRPSLSPNQDFLKGGSFRIYLPIPRWKNLLIARLFATWISLPLPRKNPQKTILGGQKEGKKYPKALPPPPQTQPRTSETGDGPIKPELNCLQILGSVKVPLQWNKDSFEVELCYRGS